MSSSQNRSVQPTVQEYSIRVPKNNKTKYNVMRFNGNLTVDFTTWNQVKMERENNIKEYKGNEEEMPKFGAGSEFGRNAREEARRKKYGIISRKYKPEDQPWILKAGGKTGKRFKGKREGGISENASYYVFTHAADGAIEAFPLHEWYNFQPIPRYKALSAEEAEQEFSRRNNVFNFFNLMARKKARNEEDGAEEEGELAEGGKAKKLSKKEKDFKISEMDDWRDSDDDDSHSESETEKKKLSEDETGAKKKKVAAKKKKKKNSDDEAFEESDDGDEEGRECDYISDSSESETELEQQKEIKSVAEEDALRKLLASDEEEEDEENSDKKDDDEKNDDEDIGEDKDKDKISKDADKRKDKKKKKKQSKKKDKRPGQNKDSSSDMSSDSGSDSDVPKDKDIKKSNSAHSSRSVTPTPAAAAVEAMKRKQSESPDISQTKRMKLDNFNSAPNSYTPGASDSGITEDAVRRYLARKPITTTELLQKFKSKKTGLSSDQLVNVMTQILKKINPTKQTIKNKMYLSLPKA